MQVLDLSLFIFEFLIVRPNKLIGRAKRAPHWGVQSRFQYVGMYVCRVLKCVGGITYAHAQSLFWAVKTDL